MTDVRLAHSDEFPHLNGARYSSARLRRTHRKHGRIMRSPAGESPPVELRDPMSDLFSDPATGYPEAEE